MDPCLLEDLWATHLRLFRHIAFAIVRQTDVAEDAIQEAFRRALRSGQQIERQDEALLYLKRVVTNTSIDYYHRRRRQETDKPLDQADRVADRPAASPEALLLQKERQTINARRLDIIASEIRSLPPEQRFAIEQLLLSDPPQGLTVLSQATGIPISTLRSRMMLGLDRIRRNLRRKGVWDGD